MACGQQNSKAVKKMKDIVSSLCNTHETVKEKVAFWLDLLPVLEQPGEWSRMEGIMQFLSRNLVAHFKREEILMDVMKRHLDLTAEEQQTLSKLLQDHEKLLAEFERLNKIASKYNPNNKTIVNDFMHTSQGIIDYLFEHAKEEDDRLFPLARKKLTAEHLEMIERQWRKK